MLCVVTKKQKPISELPCESFSSLWLHDDPRLPGRKRKADDANGDDHAKRNTFDRGRRIDWRNNHIAVPPGSKLDVIG